MRRSMRAVLWGITFLTLAALSVPWFLWGDATVVAGLPLWLWWHVGWMVLASVVFGAFARRDWDLLVGASAGPDAGGSR